MPVLAAFIVSK